MENNNIKQKEDYFIKDEGDFCTFGFISEKAKKLVNELVKENDQSILSGNDVIKLNVLNESKNRLIAWAAGHNLVGYEH